MLTAQLMATKAVLLLIIEQIRRLSFFRIILRSGRCWICGNSYQIFVYKWQEGVIQIATSLLYPHNRVPKQTSYVEVRKSPNLCCAIRSFFCSHHARFDVLSHLLYLRIRISWFWYTKTAAIKWRSFFNSSTAVSGLKNNRVDSISPHTDWSVKTVTPINCVFNG